jgi:hypothetical protein
VRMGRIVCLPGLVVLALAFASVASTATSTCCFSNRGYAGYCRVNPAEDETCASILAYLNNEMASGKSYCNSTRIHSGWELVSCEAPVPPSDKPTSGTGANR